MRFVRTSAAFLFLVAVLTPLKQIVRFLAGVPRPASTGLESFIHGSLYLFELIFLYGTLTAILWAARRAIIFAEGWETFGFKDLDVGVRGTWPYRWLIGVSLVMLLGSAYVPQVAGPAPIIEALAACVAVFAALLGPIPPPNAVDDYDPLPPVTMPTRPIPEPSPAPVAPAPSDTIQLNMAWFFRREPGVLDSPATSYQVSVAASKSRYDSLLKKDHGVRAASDYGRFVREGLTPEVFDTASELRKISEKERLGTILEINNVLAFAQRFRYVLDSEDKGVQEYPKFPLETMVEDRGDCEDHAILAAACFVRLGYDVRLVSLEYGSGPGHMALAVAGAEELPDAFAIRDPVSGRKFYYCEATTDAGSRNPAVSTFRLGEVPDRDRQARMELISVS